MLYLECLPLSSVSLLGISLLRNKVSRVSSQRYRNQPTLNMKAHDAGCKGIYS